MRIDKPYTDKTYADLAVFCNENGMVIKDEGDYLISVLPPEPTEQEKIVIRVAELKGLLNNTDYVVTKIAEAQALEQEDLVKELKEKYSEILLQRQAWREEINSYENK